ncbi:hypothetical protein BYT27DRAFT_7209849 [Phlegmacium glaucopus]|nr:hypothetical protein BYT27DRAFT_7209849 [Phlegmacium glaucopus]
MDILEPITAATFYFNIIFIPVHINSKPRARSAQTASMDAAEERAQSVPDEDEEEMAMATEVLRQLQHSAMEANTFPPPARPSRKQKRYGCDICGQIFTRSGDVRRHKESRHDNSEGCRCPFCDRVLTRQDALQRHWDKYCRKKSKRHLDKQAAETQNRAIPSMPAPVYAPGAPAQTTSTTTTMGIGTGFDQSQINYRYLNIFG